MEVTGLRGWTGQRIDLSPFPIMALVGENGSGKSTLLQAAASVYKSDDRKRTYFASEFFPETAWDKVRSASVKYGYQEGSLHREFVIRKPTTKWLGNVDRPTREVEYIDLSRIQPVAARVGYTKIAKTKHKEHSATPFDNEKARRLTEVMGREYDGARMALSDVDMHRRYQGNRPESINEINDAGELYRKAAKASVKARAKTAESRDALVATLKKHGLGTYTDNEAVPPWTVTVIPGTDKVRITTDEQEEKEAEE